MEELRNQIWDYLHRAGEPQPVDEIARQVDADPQTVLGVVDHSWFRVENDLVAIAYHGNDEAAAGR